MSGKKEIDTRVRGILKKYKIGKHFDFNIREDGFKYKVNKEALIAEVTSKSKDNQELIEKRLKRSRGHIESIAKQLAKLSQKIDKGNCTDRTRLVYVSAKLSTSTKLASISISTFATTISVLESIAAGSKKRPHSMESTSYEPAYPERKWMQTRLCAAINYSAKPKERFVPSRP